METPPRGFRFRYENTKERNARIKHRNEHPHRIYWKHGASLWDTPSPILTAIKNKNSKSNSINKSLRTKIRKSKILRSRSRKSLGSIVKKLNFKKSKTRKIKGSPKRVKTRRFMGSPKRILKSKSKTRDRNGGHHSFFW